ncbi:bifunctional homocysteine S-methyltransferase/methylenetetrahydrofolate reductase [Anaerobacillus isosaccharinicus]|uniref:Bifunctional homocysteine S-methyltransferase/methylenetetrahydrofolate reductase n=1 Tax=Anaerobacillus isosaccharinicus TaxID=1532552 RepID=A0A1S2KVT2_9BACI|nr:bifunctional homocysteine S-methyltransferase/methylenetetrahydrofolate reductase [Anaerobacillus isosaccharinicus]MBA5585828.1 bifunctional homocysteine S-methyltransferase/methylenetetrahydrofolate reductase [Anaerobacillus isosaccharinicus]QOY35876.1 bifunctional homocysteine S-methyltransferase/methylenetetrahydrofolate reductase [Anaerobacillus isosaccharinicus]
MSFLQDMKTKTLIGDGAIGTFLYLKGLDRCFEELNLSDPTKVKEVHEAYLQAGSQIIQTNTYAANKIKLTRHGLENKVAIINKAAVNCANEVVTNKDAYVIGTMGGIRGFQKRSHSMEEIVYSFEEQMNSLLECDIDGILLETFYDFEELSTCLMLARKKTDLPIISHVSLDEVGVLHGGIPLKDALSALEDLGADVVGMNCRMGPFHMLQSFEEVPLLKRAFLSAYPNASLPDYKDGRLVYQTNPKYFGDSAKAFVEQGIRLIGGCCGTTPDHIKAVADAVRNQKPVEEKQVKVKQKQSIVVFHKEQQESLPSIVQRRKSVIVELDPPKKLNTDVFVEGSKKLKEAGVDAVTLADNSLASPRICNLSLASIIKKEYNVRPLVHITCRDRNLIGLQSHLMGLHTLGINQLLAVTGDPTKIGDFPGATSVYDLASFDLIRLMKQMNNGVSFSGKDLGARTNFSVGAAFNPNGNHLEQMVRRMEKKLEYGADYFLSQPVFSIEQVAKIYEVTKHIKAPIYLGVMPLTSSKNAEFLHNEVPGIKLTEETRERMMRVSGDQEASHYEGIQIAKELIDEVHRYFNGLYLITPFLRYEMTVELTKYWQWKSKLIQPEKLSN